MHVPTLDIFVSSHGSHGICFSIFHIMFPESMGNLVIIIIIPFMEFVLAFSIFFPQSMGTLVIFIIKRSARGAMVGILASIGSLVRYSVHSVFRIMTKLSVRPITITNDLKLNRLKSTIWPHKGPQSSLRGLSLNMSKTVV